MNESSPVLFRNLTRPTKPRLLDLFCCAGGAAVGYSQAGFEVVGVDIKPGQYLLQEAPPEKTTAAFSRGISIKLRAEVLDRNGFTCQMCGLTPGEIDPATGRKVRLHIGHIKDKSFGGKDELSNLRALCSTCNQGAKNVTGEKPSEVWLLSQIRRAGLNEQRAAFDWLRKKFKE